MFFEDELTGLKQSAIIRFPRHNYSKEGFAMITGRQVAAARALLGMKQSTLADISSISIETMRRIEASKDVPPVMKNNMQMVIANLEDMGIVFIAEAMAGRGVRLRAPESAHAA